MNIIIITMRRTNRSLSEFYNVQDVGLGRSLAEMGHNVNLYNFVQGANAEIRTFGKKFRVHYLPAWAIGGHTIHSFDFLKDDADAVIAYCDNQLCYRKLVSRCKKRNVLLLPYVGVIGSHNRNVFIRAVLDIMVSNVKYFRKQTVLAKTPNVAKQLQNLKVEEVIIAPACLDMHYVKADYSNYKRDEIARYLGIDPNKRYLLYIGRMIEEKHPLEMIEIFRKISKCKKNIGLIMIGKGVLLEKVKKLITEMKMENSCLLIESVNNVDIWKYYLLASVFVNLNTEEIFGMAMLEAMFYECPVVARKAPGPEYIFKDNENGYLCNDESEIIARIELIMDKRPTKLIENAHKRILSDFVWESTAKTIENVITEKVKDGQNKNFTCTV